jgi:DNA primase
MGSGDDFDRARRSVNLREVIEADTGFQMRDGRGPCPIHGGTKPNFAIEPDGIHARCWSASCDWRGDVIDYLVTRQGKTPAEVVRDLLGESGSSPRSKAKPIPAPRPRQESSEPWQDLAWQTEVDRIVCMAEEMLWSRDGLRARDWLHARGLADHTIHRFRLGFNPSPYRTEPVEVLGFDDKERPRWIFVDRGVTLPWLAPGAWFSPTDDVPDGPPPARWVGCQVRRLMPDVFAEIPEDQSKDCCLKGSKKRLYPHVDFEPVRECLPLLLLEGEWDALIGWQTFGDLLHVGTVGGAGANPHPSVLKCLSACSPWLLGFDHDASGEEAVRAWSERAPRAVRPVRRLLLPRGKDLNDYVLAVGQEAARDWMRGQLARAARQPVQDPRQDPRAVHL